MSTSQNSNAIEINPNLTRDGEGYVYWKGQHVEHYSYGFDRMTDEALELIRRCEHLEVLGVPVRTGTAIWCWSWFADMTVNHPFLPFLRLCRDMYERGESELAWIHESEPEPKEYPYTHTVTLRIWDGRSFRDEPLRTDELGGTYHPLRAVGFDIAKADQNRANGQGLVYATTQGMTELLERHGWTRATAMEVL